jgi:uncharacterized protein YndB with AHSA1/START domain
MSQNHINLVYFIPKDRSELFRYFTIPELIEEWCAPDGMALKVPLFEARKNGQYIYIHSKGSEVWNAKGYIKEIIPDEKIVMIDSEISHNEKTTLNDISCTIDFKDALGGSEITIVHEGFPDKKSAEECREGWDQCIDKLLGLTVADVNQTDNIQREITDY